MKVKDLRARVELACGRGVTVAVVDSGWSRLQPDHRVLPGLSVVPGPPPVERHLPEHGTLCALRVLQVAPEARILPVRIFPPGIETSIERVCAGIRIACDHGAGVINLSLATRLRDAIEPLFQVCETARREGVVIVAAAHNQGCPAVPAYLEPVLSVAEGRQRGILDITYDPDGVIECTAAGITVPIADSDGREHHRSGSSIAAATVSGLMARLIEIVGPCDLDRARVMLREFTRAS